MDPLDKAFGLRVRLVLFPLRSFGSPGDVRGVANPVSIAFRGFVVFAFCRWYPKELVPMSGLSIHPLDFDFMLLKVATESDLCLALDKRRVLIELGFRACHGDPSVTPPTIFTSSITAENSSGTEFVPRGEFFCLLLSAALGFLLANSLEAFIKPNFILFFFDVDSKGGAEGIEFFLDCTTMIPSASVSDFAYSSNFSTFFINSMGQPNFLPSGNSNKMFFPFVVQIC